MLETFTLKQHLDTTRKELTQALYQHDAACRVIARLIQERDEARAILASRLGASNGHSQQSQSAMEVEHSAPGASATAAAADSGSTGITAAVVSSLNKKCEELSTHRKGRKGSAVPGLATKEEVTGMSTKPAQSFTPHKTDKPGVTCIASIPIADGASHSYNRILSGGVDKSALLMDSNQGVILSKLVGHSKKITQVSFHPQYWEHKSLYTASADGTVKVWRAEQESGSGAPVDYDKPHNYANAFTFSHHGDEVTGLSIHPSGQYAITASLDSSWAFVDLDAGG